MSSSVPVPSSGRLDRGPGYRADDTAAACRRLDIYLVLGTAAYPEGHGTIEKFNQTAQAQVLRGLIEPLDLLCELRELRPTIVHFSGHGARPAATVTPMLNRDVVPPWKLRPTASRVAW